MTCKKKAIYYTFRSMLWRQHHLFLSIIFSTPPLYKHHLTHLTTPTHHIQKSN